MKRFSPFFVVPFLLVALFVPLGASAHVARPNTVFCTTPDHCDGVFPHQGLDSQGTACTANIADLQAVNLVDKDGRVEGVLHLFKSQICDTMWATVYATTTYMTAGNEQTNRFETQDDSVAPCYNQCTNSYTWPYYSQGQWLDVGMLGFDNDLPSAFHDCFNAFVRWEDRYQTVRNAQTGDFCN